MGIIESILFGILQGVFEWLPISSTGELMLIMINFFDYTIQHATELAFFLHFGTVFSAIVYFRKDVRSIVSNFVRYRPNFAEKNRLITFLLISTIISGALGFFVYKLTEDLSVSAEVLLGIIGLALIFTGLIQKFSKQHGFKTEKDLNFKDSILLGIVQAFSAIPGLSRSGLTVSSFLFRGYQGKDSLRLSFLMGIPAIIGAQVGLIVINGFPQMNTSELAASLVFSFVFGYISIGVLIKIATKVKFWIFTIIIGSIALLSFLGLF